MTTTNRDQAINIIRDALETGKTDVLEATLQSIRVRREDAFTPRYTPMVMIHIVESVPYANLLWCAIPAKDRTTFRDAVKGGDEAFVTYAGTDHGKRMFLVLDWIERHDARDVGEGMTLDDLIALIDRVETTTFASLSDGASLSEARGTHEDLLYSAAQIAIQATIVQVGRYRVEDLWACVNNFLGMLSPLVTDQQLKSLSPQVMNSILRALIANKASA